MAPPASSRFNQSVIYPMPMGNSVRYSPFQSLPPKMTKYFKTNNARQTQPLDRTLVPVKTRSGFQPLNIKPLVLTSSCGQKLEAKSDDSLSDKSIKPDEKLPLYMRSASPNFQFVVPEIRRPVTRSR